MKTSKKAVLLPALFVVCAIPLALKAQPAGGSLTGSVAEYNAAQVRDTSGQLTVPTGMTTYTANTAITVGTTFNVSLPAGMEFTTPNLPGLSSSDETFQLVKISGPTAQFVVLTSDNAATSTITLGSYSVKGASALQKIVPVANALPITMQAVGIDPQPLAFPEFASDSGIQAVFVGAIQFIDLKPPSNGNEFGTGGATDSPVGVLSAIAVSTEVQDYTTHATAILGPDGQPNTLADYDTVTIAIPGALYGGMHVYSSITSQCNSKFTEGTVTSDALIFRNIPLNREIFFCTESTGKEMMKLIGFPSGGFITNTSPAFTTVEIVASHPYDDYLTSTNVNIEYSGNMCYSYSGGACVNSYFNLFHPKPD